MLGEVGRVWGGERWGGVGRRGQKWGGLQRTGGHEEPDPKVARVSEFSSKATNGTTFAWSLSKWRDPTTHGGRLSIVHSHLLRRDICKVSKWDQLEIENWTKMTDLCKIWLRRLSLLGCGIFKSSLMIFLYHAIQTLWFIAYVNKQWTRLLAGGNGHYFF